MPQTKLAIKLYRQRQIYIIPWIIKILLDRLDPKSDQCHLLKDCSTTSVKLARKPLENSHKDKCANRSSNVSAVTDDNMENAMNYQGSSTIAISDYHTSAFTGAMIRCHTFACLIDYGAGIDAIPESGMFLAATKAYNYL